MEQERGKGEMMNGRACIWSDTSYLEREHRCKVGREFFSLSRYGKPFWIYRFDKCRHNDELLYVDEMYRVCSICSRVLETRDGRKSFLPIDKLCGYFPESFSEKEWNNAVLWGGE